MARVDSTTNERSGSRESVRGVGTQIRMASGSPRRSNRSVASNPEAVMERITSSERWPM